MKLVSIAATVFVLATSTHPFQQAYAQDAYTQRFGLNNLEMLCVVNLVRERVGAGPLAHCDAVAAVAAKHSVNMDRTVMEHTLNGLSPFDRLRRAGIDSRASGENIAKGQDTLENVMQDWISSCGHYENIINPDYNEAGFGRAGDSWTQDFVSLQSSQPTTAVDMSQCRQVVDFSVYSFAKADRCSGAPRPVRVIETSNDEQTESESAAPPPEPQEDEAVPLPPAPEEEEEQEEDIPVIVANSQATPEEEVEEATPEEVEEATPEEEDDEPRRGRGRRGRRGRRHGRRRGRQFSRGYGERDEVSDEGQESPAKKDCDKK